MLEEKAFFSLRLLMKHGTGRMFIVVPLTKTLGGMLKSGRWETLFHESKNDSEMLHHVCVWMRDRGAHIYSIYSMCCHCSGLLLLQTRHRIGRELQ